MRQPTPEEWTVIRDQFDRLCHLPPDARRDAIERAAIDPFIADQLRSLLAAEQADGILDAPLSDAAQDVGIPYASLAPGTSFDGYTIRALIGRGGMGEVYEAERAGFGFAQRVALKLLRPEAIGRMASFDAERALLAGLEHPGIARLIDGGIAPDSRPYMAIEFVEGQPITHWCANRGADLPTRLDLFLGVCAAVAHAHGRMIVHRDIKPANILIDAQGRPRLLDFGVAKLIDAAGSDRTVTMPMLTPDYAAPEQLANEATTAATDVYALGAVLFELLTESRPWQLPGGQLPAMLRRVLNDDLPLPSRVAADVQHSPVAARAIAGDLDAIILKAMRRDPAQRYASVEALAADVRAHLTLAPVTARAGTTRYFVSRFVKRHRWPVAGAAAALLALLVGTGGVVWQARQTAIERDSALAEAARLEGTNRAMLFMFRDAKDMRQLESISARELIDGTTRRLLRSAPVDAPDTAPMIAALADLYLIVESNREAKALLGGAVARGVGRNNPVDLARLQLKLGTVLALERQPAQARQLLAAADRIWRDDPARYRRERVEAVGAEALMLRHEGRLDAAIARLEANMAEAQRVYAAYDRDLAMRYTVLAGLLIDAGRLDRASAVLADGDARLTRRAGPPSASGLNLRWLEAEVLVLRGDGAAAERLLRATIADRRRYYGDTGELAIDLLRLSRLPHLPPAKALPLLRAALPISVEYFGSSSDATLQVRIAYAEGLARLHQTASASAVLKSAALSTDRLSQTSLLRARFLRSRAILALADRHVAERDLAAADAIARLNGRGADLFRLETRGVMRRVRGRE